jgi:hypothetical protein
MRTLLVLAVALAAACGGSSKQPDPMAPRADDIPTELTCCVGTDPDGTPTYERKAAEQCPEEQRNPLDTCDLGPGELPRKQ